MKNLPVKLAVWGLSVALFGAAASAGQAADQCVYQSGMSPACHQTACKGAKSGGLFGWLKGRGCNDGCDANACHACKGKCQGQCNGRCNGPYGGCCCTPHIDTLNTNVGIGLQQQLRVGEIQVDECKLEQILAARRHQRALEQQLYGQYLQAQDQFYAQQCQRQLQHYVNSLGIAGDCSRPYDPCAALPPPLACELPPPPPCTPLRPTEIPLVIPVTLQLGVENTCLEQPCVRQIPLPPACKQPCSPCPTGYPTVPPAMVPAQPATPPPSPVGSRVQPGSRIAPAGHARVSAGGWAR